MRPALNRAREILGETEELIGVEVGVLRGECSREILREWENTRLYLVDNYVCGLHELEEAKVNLKPWEDRFEWRIGDSVEQAKELHSLDFAYIDGDHSYEGVKKDIEAYWAKIRSGGVLAGHDYNPNWESLEGIIRAVDEFVAREGLELWTATTGSSSDWVVVKP